MKFSESPVIHVLRSVILLATLILIPCIAIFWNHLPDHFVRSSTPMPAPPKTEEMQFPRKESSEAAASVSMVAMESIDPLLPKTHVSAASLPTVLLPAVPYAQQEVVVVPSASNVTPDAAIQQVSWGHPQSTLPQDFESLRSHLNSLGVKHFKLEKWGNRGELFRFSCFVTPSESYSYAKPFSAIGADAVTVIRSVIAEIEAWRAASLDR
jgi:hypothetical protein